MTEQSMSDVLDDIQRRTRQEPAPTMSAEDARRAAESRLDNRTSARARRAFAKRYSTVKAALMGAVEGMAHGETYSAAERHAIVDGVVKALGGDVSASTLKAIEGAIETASEHVADGSKVEGWRAAEAAAESIASDDETIGAASTSDDDTNDPAALAALVGRA